METKGNPTADTPLDQADSNDVADLIDQISLKPQGYDEPLALRDAMADIMTSHMKLNAYRHGSMLLVDALDHEIDLAKEEGHAELVELLEDVRSSGVRIAERVKPPMEGEKDNS